MQPSIKRLDKSAEYYFQEGCYITELSNSEDDPSLSIARARVVPGESTQLHKLIDTVERYVILDGKGEVELDNRIKEQLNKHDVVIIPPNCPQKITNTGTHDLIFLVICTPRFYINQYEEI